MGPDRIPLFPLNVVLIPGADLPLHIFEQRYRQMVHHCLETHSPFGMLLAVPNGINSVGCTAEILTIVKRYADGRMDILTRGRHPFRVTQFFSEKPLLEGVVEYLQDIDDPVDPALVAKLVELFDTCHTLLFGEYARAADSDDPEAISYRIASTLPLDLIRKQQILELRGERDRQQRLLAMLQEWAPQLAEAKNLRHHAAGNGHGPN